MNKEKLNAIAKKRHIPKNYSCGQVGDLIFYTKITNSEAYAKAYTEKSFNPLWHYRFRGHNLGESVSRMKEKIQETICARKAQKDSVKKRRVERLKPHTLKVGDILYCSWGYGQTNIDFFQVDELVGKNKIKIVGLETKFVSGDGFSDKVVPGSKVGNSWTQKGRKITEDGVEYKNVKLLKVASSCNSVRLSSFAYASKWDGNPLHQTDPRAGH